MIAICVRTLVMDRPLGKVPWGFLKLYALYPNFGNWSMSIFIIIIVYHVNLCVFLRTYSLGQFLIHSKIEKVETFLTYS